MPHWPLTDWGLTYIAALAIFGFIAVVGFPVLRLDRGFALGWARPTDRRARRILVIMVGHAAAWAAIMAYSPDNFFLWLASDLAIIGALLWFGRSGAAWLASLVYWAVLVQDGWFLRHNLDLTLDKLPVDKSSILAEFAGYIAMLIMAGTAHDLGGGIHSLARRLVAHNRPGLAGSAIGERRSSRPLYHHQEAQAVHRESLQAVSKN